MWVAPFGNELRVTSGGQIGDGGSTETDNELVASARDLKSEYAVSAAAT
jgi:hypothetical protein